MVDEYSLINKLIIFHVLTFQGIELNPKQNGFWRMLKFCQEKLGDMEGAQETERLMLLQEKK